MIKKKLSQVTIFIILAIVIVAVVGLFFLYRSNIFSGESVSPEVSEIHDYVLNCLSETGENAVYYVGQTGGYFNSPNLSTEFGIAYYYSDGKSYIPTKERIEKELEDYMDYMLYFCTRDFTDFPEYEVEQGTITTNAKISENKVDFNVNYPLSIKKGEKTYTLKKFDAEIPVRLDEIYELAYKMNQEQLIDGEDICLSCMQEWATESDLYVEMNDYSNKSGIIIFTIRDENYRINDLDYRFIFANKY